MPFTPFEASAPVFIATLGDMRAWLDKADAGDEARLIAARLADDMRPLPAQYQMASDTAKNTSRGSPGSTRRRWKITSELCRPARSDGPTIAFIQGVDPAALADSDARDGRAQVSKRDGLS